MLDYPGAMDDAVHALNGEDAASYHEDEETYHVLPRYRLTLRSERASCLCIDVRVLHLRHLDFKDVKGRIEHEMVGARAEKGGLSLDDDSLSLDGDSQQSLSPSSFDGPRQGRGAPQGRFQQARNTFSPPKQKRNLTFSVLIASPPHMTGHVAAEGSSQVRPQAEKGLHQAPCRRAEG